MVIVTILAGTMTRKVYDPGHKLTTMLAFESGKDYNLCLVLGMNLEVTLLSPLSGSKRGTPQAWSTDFIS